MSFDDYETNEAHERRITRCKSCNQKIIWFKTEAGNNMPVDEHTVGPDDQEFDIDRHTSHFATCPNPDQHRKRK